MMAVVAAVMVSSAAAAAVWVTVALKREERTALPICRLPLAIDAISLPVPLTPKRPFRVLSLFAS